MIPERVGRYEIKSQLGQGGMATVYRAFDPLFKREVAVKILPRQLMLDDPKFRSRFEREAETIATLEHPAIVPVYDFGEENGQPYLVMRLMIGGSLDERIAQGALPAAEATRVLDRIGSALDLAHDQGIIHRDLKPGNILFDQYGDAYLADFGIVRISHSRETLTATGSIIGTPAYMSPEQIQGSNIDGRSDIYALGIIVFEMLTGKKPFEASTPAMMLVKQMTEPMPRVLDVMPGLPFACEEVITRATAKEADRRYGRAGQMAETLNIALRNEPPTVKTPVPATTMKSMPSDEPSLTEPTAPVEETERSVPLPSSRRGLLFVGIGIVAILGIILFFALSGRDDVNLDEADQSSTNLDGNNTTISIADVSQMVPLHQLGRGTLEAAELSPDGQKLAVGSSTGTWIYDAHSLEPENLLQGHSDNVSAVAWSPDGSQIVSAGWDNTLRLWDVTSGEQIGIIQGEDQFIAVAWSPDGSQLAAATWGSSILLFDAQTTRQIGELVGHDSSVQRLRFSPDGRWLASADGGENSSIRIWERETGEEKFDFTAHDGDIANIHWSPDSTHLISAGLTDSLVRVWDIEGGSGEAQLELAGHEYGAYDATWSPDGSEIVTTGGDNLLLAWDAENGRQTGQLLETTDAVIRMIPLVDSNQYLLFQSNGTISIANAVNGNIDLIQQEHTAAMQQVVWSPDQQTLATANSDGTIRLWNPVDGSQIANWRAHEYGVTTLDWTPEGTMILSAGGDGTVRLWDVVRQEIINEWSHPDGSVSSLALSPDGTTVAIADWSGYLWLMDAQLETVVREWQAHGDAITRVAWSPDGQALATSSSDKIVTIWNAANGTESLVLEEQPDEVSDVAWSPDGSQLATTAHDFTIRVWDVASGDEVWQKTHLNSAWSVAWSPDGRILASGGSDQTIRLWDALDGTKLGELDQHVRTVNTLAWSPNGDVLASGSDDGTAIIWHVAE